MLYSSPFHISESKYQDYDHYQKRGVIVFGTGNLGALALHSLKQKNIKLICFVDNNTSNWDKQFKGCDVISPEKLKSEYKDYPVLICSLNFKYIKRQLKSLGIEMYMIVIFIFKF